MNRDPAFLFYSSDFLTGVADLTMEERGQYITLLCLQHQHGHLSGKTICLSLGYRSVSEIGDVMNKFQQDEQGLYYQHRLDEEIEKRQKYTDSRRLNGVKGGRPKATVENHMDNHMDSISEPYGEPTDNHTENENDNRDNIDNRGGAGGEEGELLQVEICPGGDNYTLSTVETKKRGRKKTVSVEKQDPILLFGSVKNVKLTQKEYDNLKSDYPLDAEDIIEFLSLQIADKGDTSTAQTHIYTIKKWVIDAVRSRKEKGWKGYVKTNGTPATPEKKPFTYESRIEL